MTDFSKCCLTFLTYFQPTVHIEPTHWASVLDQRVQTYLAVCWQLAGILAGQPKVVGFSCTNQRILACFAYSVHTLAQCVNSDIWNSLFWRNMLAQCLGPMCTATLTKTVYTIPPRKSYFYSRKTVRKSSLLRTVLVFEFRTLQYIRHRPRCWTTPLLI